MISIKNTLFFTMALSATSVLMASPAATQQSVLMVDQEPTVIDMPEKLPKTVAERAALLKVLLKNPAFKAAYEKMLKHPNLTYTAKSVFTPAGIPMSWGGVGFAVGTFNRYPTATKDAWPTGETLALPFGDSDKIIGGAVSVNWANLTNNLYPNPSYGNNTGTVSLTFSRWLAANTIASAGVINLAPWGLMNEAPHSYSAVITQMFGLPVAGSYHPMSASVGMGSGAFGPIGQLGSITDSTIYPFVNAAFNFTPDIAIAGDYYAETFAVGLSYNTVIKIPIMLPLSFMLFAGNLKHSDIAPSTVFGLRVSTGVALPSFKRTE